MHFHWGRSNSCIEEVPEDIYGDYVPPLFNGSLWKSMASRKIITNYTKSEWTLKPQLRTFGTRSHRKPSLGVFLANVAIFVNQVEECCLNTKMKNMGKMWTTQAGTMCKHLSLAETNTISSLNRRFHKISFCDHPLTHKLIENDSADFIHTLER